MISWPVKPIRNFSPFLPGLKKNTYFLSHNYHCDANALVLPILEQFLNVDVCASSGCRYFDCKKSFSVESGQCSDQRTGIQ